jgi:hypothetical protein
MFFPQSKVRLIRYSCGFRGLLHFFIATFLQQMPVDFFLCHQPVQKLASDLVFNVCTLVDATLPWLVLFPHANVLHNSCFMSLWTVCNKLKTSWLQAAQFC